MTILHNVRKFYGTDLYEIEDVISYSRGSSHYGTPVYVAGLSDYCMYYSESLGSFILEQHDPINNEWNQVDTIPVVNVPTSVRFTFDQNGHIAIVWESGNDIYRHWYDTAVNEAITTHVGKGRSPHILMESYNEVLQPIRQIVMVYVTDDDRLVYRLQDDRYTIEYFIEDNVEAVVMLGHTVRNSVKLVYLAREGIYNYRYKAVGSDRLGEWFGDNAAGEDIQFIIEELSLESVIHTLPFSENPVNLDRSLSNVNLHTIPSVIDKSMGTENPVSISRSLSNLSITKRPTIFTEEFEEPVPPPILSSVLLDSLYLDIRDVRIDIVQEELVIPPPIQTNIEDIRLEIYVEVAQLAMLYNQLLGQNLDEEVFTVESWADYQNALDAAELVIGDPTASRQLVTDTFYALRGARGDLVYREQVGEGGDPQWTKVIHLMPLDETFGDVIHPYANISEFNNPRIVSDVTLFGKPVAKFSGRGYEDVVQYEYSNVTEIGMDDFTIEFHMHPVTLPSSGQYAGVLSSRRTSTSDAELSFLFEFNGNGHLLARMYGPSYTVGAEILYDLPITNVWQHVAWVRKDGIFRLYIDGQLVGENAGYPTLPFRPFYQGLSLGHVNIPPSGTNYYDGYLANVRITQGVARYWDTFIPPSTQYPTYPDFWEVELIVDSREEGIWLRWSTESTIHTAVNIYKDIAPMDPENLPEPYKTIDSELGNMYLDTDVVLGTEYYYIVDLVSEQNSKPSLEKNIVHKLEIGDPHWDNVVALLHFDGNTVNQVTQNSETVKGILTFQQYDPLFGMSVEIDASEDMGILLSDGFDTSGDFTIETLSKKINGTKYFIIDNRTPQDPGTFYVGVEDGKLMWRIFGLHASKQFTVDFPEGFNHVALVKETNRYSLYLNGVGVDSVIGNVPTLNRIVAVGFSESTKSDTNGVHLLDEFRITKGVARYTENFTPPTEPFPNFGVDTSPPENVVAEPALLHRPIVLRAHYYIPEED